MGEENVYARKKKVLFLMKMISVRRSYHEGFFEQRGLYHCPSTSSCVTKIVSRIIVHRANCPQA